MRGVAGRQPTALERASYDVKQQPGRRHVDGKVDGVVAPDLVAAKVIECECQEADRTVPADGVVLGPDIPQRWTLSEGILSNEEAAIEDQRRFEAVCVDCDPGRSEDDRGPKPPGASLRRESGVGGRNRCAL